MNVPLHNRIEYNSFLQKISFILMTSTKIWHWKSRWKSLWEGDVGCQENKTSSNLLSHEFQTRNAVSAMTWITKFGAPNKLLCPCIFFFLVHTDRCIWNQELSPLFTIYSCNPSKINHQSVSIVTHPKGTWNFLIKLCL